MITTFLRINCNNLLKSFSAIPDFFNNSYLCRSISINMKEGNKNKPSYSRTILRVVESLIKDSTTRRIVLEYDGLFLFPSFIFIEMERHRYELLKKSGMAEKDLSKLLQLILKKVVIIPNEVLAPYKREAYEIVKYTFH